MFTKAMLAVSAASMIALPSAASARDHHYRDGYSHSYRGGYGYRGYGYGGGTVISVGLPSYGYYGGYGYPSYGYGYGSGYPAYGYPGYGYGYPQYGYGYPSYGYGYGYPGYSYGGYGYCRNNTAAGAAVGGIAVLRSAAQWRATAVTTLATATADIAAAIVQPAPSSAACLARLLARRLPIAAAKSNNASFGVSRAGLGRPPESRSLFSRIGNERPLYGPFRRGCAEEIELVQGPPAHPLRRPRSLAAH